MGIFYVRSLAKSSYFLNSFEFNCSRCSALDEIFVLNFSFCWMLEPTQTAQWIMGGTLKWKRHCSLLLLQVTDHVSNHVTIDLYPFVLYHKNINALDDNDIADPAGCRAGIMHELI